MKLYQGKITEFTNLVKQNKITDILVKNFLEYYGKNPSSSEKSSWANSLNFIKNIFELSQLKDNWLIVEYELPFSSRRIDLILFGKDENNNENIIIVELKQWSNKSIKRIEDDGNLLVQYGKHLSEVAHPCIQVEGYYFYLKDFVTIFNEEKISLSACVYCHNYSRNNDRVLFSDNFKDYFKKYPIFCKEDAEKLGVYLKERLSKGDGFEVFNRFINSKIKPSKKLLDHTSEMINKQQIFTLIDDQIVAYKAITSKVKNLSRSKKKHIFIIKGGPGTGKSVIALELMGELLRKDLKVFHATGSSAFTNTLRSILGNRARHLFKFFNSFVNSKKDSIDVLICDEAHRIRRTSISRYTPNYLRTNTPQVEELISSAKIVVFFIDEWQIVRPNEIGSVKLIKDHAIKLGVEPENIHEYELKTQFRCSGSDTYLQWLDNILGVRQTDYQFLTRELKMEFKIFDDPVELKRAIDEKNKEKRNSARIVAGFCWPWSDPLPDGSLVKDVKIGNLEMPWEKKNQFWKWATDDSGMEQVGTVYTAQGFEFDYIGVIFGNDLVYDKLKKKWVAKPENSYDIVAKRNNPEFVRHLKNVYRVLMSRAHKGVYVYFIDRDTREYFESKIKE